ncbi:hypothetical protein EDC30_103227 [Paucimonas lemoignei]|uniref:Uncharacterized protein n=1 Tax=Paucimonas lemoignei TaxID=29443 RepID=A0A4R3I058_PAULE|nr:hypothetical protein EDC30_103227 [Paucimonas lemoignei]
MTHSDSRIDIRAIFRESARLYFQPLIWLWSQLRQLVRYMARSRAN